MSVWPYVPPSGPPQPELVATALRVFHDTMASCTVELPTLTDVFRRSAELADDATELSAIDEESRSLLSGTLRHIASEVEDLPRVVVHGEPHDGNLIARAGDVVLIDLEGTQRAPVEWDLAFRPETEIDELWRDADHELLDVLRVGVSAQVATYCWRHVTARPYDQTIRWHAEHHLGRIALRRS